VVARAPGHPGRRLHPADRQDQAHRRYLAHPVSPAAPVLHRLTLAFVNEDAGAPHNVEFKDSGGASAYKGAIFPGVETRVYDVPALPVGSYTFVCSVHPNMTGSATLQ